jgi:hypothetical protein
MVTMATIMCITYMYLIYPAISLFDGLVGLWCLMPFKKKSVILWRQFYLWMKLEYPEKTPNLS